MHFVQRVRHFVCKRLTAGAAHDQHAERHERVFALYALHAVAVDRDVTAGAALEQHLGHFHRAVQAQQTEVVRLFFHHIPGAQQLHHYAPPVGEIGAVCAAERPAAEIYRILHSDAELRFRRPRRIRRATFLIQRHGHYTFDFHCFPPRYEFPLIISDRRSENPYPRNTSFCPQRTFHSNILRYARGVMP